MAIRYVHFYLFKKPLMCLTATPNSDKRMQLIKILKLKHCHVIKFSPEKPIVKIILNNVSNFDKLPDLLEECIQMLLSKETCPKSIIYCSSLKMCGHFYLLLKERFSNEEFPIAMYHSKTPDLIKEKVLNDFILANSFYRIIIATSALGMGVNIPNIRNVFHFGLPSDVESYVQEIGRAGRDGGKSVAVLSFRGCDKANANADIKSFVSNTMQCRRQLLMSYFNEDSCEAVILHECCDVCLKTCGCSVCSKEKSSASTKICSNAIARKCLKNLIVSNTISKLVDNINSLFSEDDLVKHGVPRVLTRNNLDILNELFGDIETSC